MEQETQEHENAYGLVGLAPLEEYLWLKLVENLVEDLFCYVKRRSAEQNPAGSNQVKGEGTAYEYHNSIF